MLITKRMVGRNVAADMSDHFLVEGMDGVKRALNDRRVDMREASERARNRNEW